MSRFDNRLPGAPPDALEPLLNVNTGERIQSVHSRADFAGMTCTFGQMWRWQSVCMSWDLAVPKQKEDSFRQVKKAYTVRTSTLTSPWVSIGTGTPTKDPVYNMPPKYTL
ncbi:hypothetical protein E4U47_007545 [Claviceps purpurea]|nr:hypothetical protein E4U38_000229 [Claviceps purpurea]KAG6263022.1 hypothetical protein E4U47_007545 [Claviceps purpurea]